MQKQFVEDQCTDRLMVLGRIDLMKSKKLQDRKLRAFKIKNQP